MYLYLSEEVSLRNKCDNRILVFGKTSIIVLFKSYKQRYEIQSIFSIFLICANLLIKISAKSIPNRQSGNLIEDYTEPDYVHKYDDLFENELSLSGLKTEINETDHSY